MEISIAGTTYVFGNLYDVTFTDGETERLIFTGVKRSNHDGRFRLWFEHPDSNSEQWFLMSDIAIADPVEY